MALQSDRIGPECLDLALRNGFGKWEHVLRHHAVTSHKAMASHAAKLMDTGKRANHCVILDGDMSGQRGPVCEYGMVTDDAIVRNVGIGHDQVPVADSGDAASPLRASMHGDEFTECVSITDYRLRSFSMEFQVLGNHADRCIGEKLV